jgi:hypothetical protein
MNPSTFIRSLSHNSKWTPFWNSIVYLVWF